MEIYLVGGAIRDQLLELPIHERDWVVVGATPQELLDQHFTQVGKDFPVFLHPDTKEEYALARTERKSGKGYTGFVVNADASVTLEEDLLRRDLTVNAIAQAQDGTLVDPFHGQDDLTQKLLRHVSPAFIEDPLRVLRVARFMARLGPLGFTVTKGTIALMQKMAEQGDLSDLVPERVWKEWHRALSEKAPHLFIQTLEKSHALAALFPEITDATHACTLLIEASNRTKETLIRFAVMISGLDPDSMMALCKRYKIPKKYAELARHVSQSFSQYQTIFSATPEEVLQLFKNLDAFRQPERFSDFLFCCDIITATKETAIDQSAREFLSMLLVSLQKIDTQTFIKQGIEGPALGTAINEARITLIAKSLNK